MTKSLVRLLLGLLPASRMKNKLLRLSGWDVSASATIHPVIFLGVTDVKLGVNARLGPFSVYFGLSKLWLADSARVGQWNWISAARPLVSLSTDGGVVEVGEHSAITSRHYMDSSGGIRIGRFTTVAGVRSTFITHGISWHDAKQHTKPIVVGDYCLISSNVSVTPGTRIADCVVVGMGAVVSGIVGASASLQLTDRARTVKVNLDGEYFRRRSGVVGSANE